MTNPTLTPQQHIEVGKLRLKLAQIDAKETQALLDWTARLAARFNEQRAKLCANQPAEVLAAAGVGVDGLEDSE
jgi:hypothetical protein